MNNLKIDLKAPIQKIILNTDGTKLKAPFSMTISGPSQCGKSEFIFNLIKFRADVVTSDFKRIIYCQSNYFSVKNLEFFDPLKKEFEALEILQGLPDINELQLTFNNEPALLIASSSKQGFQALGNRLAVIFADISSQDFTLHESNDAIRRKLKKGLGMLKRAEKDVLMPMHETDESRPSVDADVIEVFDPGPDGHTIEEDVLMPKTDGAKMMSQDQPGY